MRFELRWCVVDCWRRRSRESLEKGFVLIGVRVGVVRVASAARDLGEGECHHVCFMYSRSS